jgi:hypothetical protein
MNDSDYKKMGVAEQPELIHEGDLDLENYYIRSADKYIFKAPPFFLIMRWAYIYGITMSTERHVPGIVLNYKIDGESFCENWDFRAIPQKIVEIIKRMWESEDADDVLCMAAALLKEDARRMAEYSKQTEGSEK